MKDDKVLLLTKYLIEARYYTYNTHVDKGNVTWETSDTREWLNGEYFYNRFFPIEEQDHILLTSIKNPDNPSYKTDGGNDTKDRIFLLSKKEVEKYMPNESDRISQGTVYSIADSKIYADVMKNAWYLRDPGETNRLVMVVNKDGLIEIEGRSRSEYSGIYIRPAMWIDTTAGYHKTGETLDDFIKTITGKDNTSSQKTSPTSTPKPASVSKSQTNALQTAKDYLSFSAFSYDGLIDQLEYEGFSNSDAKYAVDNCGADWNKQALKSAKSYLDYSAFSYDGLIKQLEYEKFTSSQAKYGADNCGANWNEQAAKCAKSYLEYFSFSRAELIDQLKYEGFTYEQALYGVDKLGL